MDFETDNDKENKMIFANIDFKRKSFKRIK